MKKLFLAIILSIMLLLPTTAVSADPHPAPGSWYEYCYYEDYWAWVGWPRLWERSSRYICEMRFY